MANLIVEVRGRHAADAPSLVVDRVEHYLDKTTADNFTSL